jgi:hypothetical protein
MAAASGMSRMTLRERESKSGTADVSVLSKWDDEWSVSEVPLWNAPVVLLL